jgi:hypothetical protein
LSLVYPKVLEWETAIAFEIQRIVTLLSSDISTTGKFAHLSWENTEINEETPSGS